jgi:hypothetical protein
MRKVLALVVVTICGVFSVSAKPRQANRHGAANLGKPRLVRVGPPTTYLKEGLSTEDVLRVLGEPTAIAERSEKDVVVMIYEFPRGEGRILIAEFVKGALVRSAIETRGPGAQADR